MDGYTELAKLFKERNNPRIPGARTGRVIYSLRLDDEIRIQLNDNVVMRQHKLIFLSGVPSTLERGDEVILIPTNGGQEYFVLGKAVRL